MAETYLERIQRMRQQATSGTASPPAQQAQPAPQQPASMVENVGAGIADFLSPTGGVEDAVEAVAEQSAATAFDPAMLAEVAQGVQPEQELTRADYVEQGIAKMSADDALIGFDERLRPNATSAVGDAIAGQEGILEKTVAGVAEALDQLSPIRQVANLGEQVAQHGSDSQALTLLSSAGDMFSAGTMDHIAAADYARREAMNGRDFDEAYSERKELINYGLEENRIDNPAASILGSVVGGVAQGLVPLGALGKAQQLQSWFRRTAAAGVSASGQAALYRYNSDGTPQEIKKDAMLGMAGGLLLAGAGGAIGGLLRKMTGSQSHHHEQLAAQEMLDAINRANATRGLDPMDARGLQEMIATNGPEATIAEVYPEMLPLFRAAAASDGNGAGQEAVASFLRFRNLNADQFPNAVRDAITIPRLRDPQEFAQFIGDTQKRLRPRYEAAFRAADANGTSFIPRNVVRDVDQVFRFNPTGTVKHRKEVMKILNREIAANTPAATRANPTPNMSLRSLNNVRRALNTEISTRMGRDKGMEVSGLYAALDAVTARMSGASDELAQLNRVYSNSSNVRRAYTTGYDMFKNTKSDPTSVNRFLASANSYAETTGFVHGVRRQLLEQTRKYENNPNGIMKFLVDNTQRIDTLRAAIGQKEADDLVRSVLGAARKEQLAVAGNAATAARPAAGVPQSPIRRLLQNLGIASMTGGAGSVRAAGDILDGTPGVANRGQAAAMGDVRGEALMGQLQNMPSIMSELGRTANYGRPSGLTERAVGVGGGTAGIIGQAGNAQETSQRTQAELDQLEAMSRGQAPR